MWNLYYLLSFVFGLVTGSFLNACLWRTRENLSIVRGRSICPHCRHQLAWFDNIPLFSFFILLRGKCRYCRAPISWQYPLVELATGLLFLLVAGRYQGNDIFITPEMVRDWLIICFLIFIFVYDLKHQEILDRATLFPAIIFYLFFISMRWESWDNLLLAAVVGGGFFFVQYFISQSKWIGGGDIRLGIFMGVLLGWPKIVLALALAYVVGALASVFLIWTKKSTLKSETPFGTYLVFATFIAMYWGEGIIQWYLGLLK